MEQILQAEIQHYLRSKIGRDFRKRAAHEAQNISQKAHELLMETYREECTHDDSGPSHVDLIRDLLLIGGISQEAMDSTLLTPANAVAISLYKDISDRGPLHHMIGAGAVEYFYSELSPKIFSSYTAQYGMSANQAMTYQIHGPMDREHAERALSILDEPYVQEHSASIKLAVRDAFVATSLHYDGMLQGATGIIAYWNGK